MQKTILVVEDDDELRNYLKKILATHHYKVAEAADGAAALEAVEKFSPDLVLLDFGLPKVPGETVCVRIKQDHPEIIVIALTEKKQSKDVVHGLQIGVDDYISKPFVPEELIARIDTRFKTVPNGNMVSEEESNTKQGEEAVSKGKITFRESLALIVIRIILTEAIFGFSLFLLSMLDSLASSYVNFNLFGLYALFFIAGFLVNLVVIWYIALKWTSEYTEVSRDGVIRYSGILHKKEQKFACNFVEAVTIEQSFLGQIFNYGTIELYDPALKERVYLINISSPKVYSKRIEKIVEKPDTQPMPFVAP
ncbi:response regulator [Candidatus Daviesbacteria bacterium]|nr:response regulator [Candidatus Daviesbacteria bacterium]